MPSGNPDFKSKEKCRKCRKNVEKMSKKMSGGVFRKLVSQTFFLRRGYRTVGSDLTKPFVILFGSVQLNPPLLDFIRHFRIWDQSCDFYKHFFIKFCRKVGVFWLKIPLVYVCKNGFQEDRKTIRRSQQWPRERTKLHQFWSPFMRAKDQTVKRTMTTTRVAGFFLVQHTKTEKMYQMTTKCIKWP
jgi:hypothetical protein